jgi:UPF0755 protein
MEKKSLWPIFWASITSFVSIATFCTWGIYAELHRPFKSYEKERYILIPYGQSSAKIAYGLERNGAVSSAILLRWYLRWRGPEFSLKAGEYRLDRPLSLIEVAKKIHQGDIHLYRATLPEGLTFRQVTARLESDGFGPSTDFNEICLTPDLIIDLDREAPNLEGYLFPETYYFAKNTSTHLIISRFVEEFRLIWTKSRQQQADDLGMTLREIVTLASLIEKETSMPSERPLVSAVLHNRLKRDMKLECDPTVIYAVQTIKKYDGTIHRSDLALDSPYNTYRYPGLPPGPIASPGLTSIDAALRPAEVDYLYFVSRNNGSHIFSNNYRDHHKAVLEYQR